MSPTPGRSHRTLVPALLAVLLLAGAAGLAGCGKKPGTLSPPEDAEEIGYPRSYPAT